MKLFKSICLLFLINLSFLVSLSAQNRIISGVIIDESTKDAVPYAQVTSNSSKNGTLTEFTGVFSIPIDQNDDTLFINMIGYSSSYITLEKTPLDTLKLISLVTVLNEAVKTHVKTDLYRLVSNLKKDRYTKSRQAKTYYFLESYINNNKIEAVEAFYNGVYENGNLVNLKLKRGKIALRCIDNKCVINSGSAKVFMTAKAFTSNIDMPISPLELVGWRLKNNYNLKMVSSYSDNNEQIYVIDCFPKKRHNFLFKARIWCNPLSNKLIKLDLECKKALVHPFSPIGQTEINNVGLLFERTYRDVAGKNFVDEIKFDYEIQYKTNSNEILTASSIAIIKPFDYQDTFKTPLFNYSISKFKDYRDILLAPPDSSFWKTFMDFRFWQRYKENRSFFNDYELTNGDIVNMYDDEQFGSNYIKWSTKRITYDPLYKSFDNASFKHTESSKSLINFKLFLDKNEFGKYSAYALIDPVGSFSHIDTSNVEFAFVNMAFDLLEINKRALIEDLNSNPDISNVYVNNKYEQCLKNFRNEFKVFQMETNRGKDGIAMGKWNNHIKNNLGLDNIKKFKIEP